MRHEKSEPQATVCFHSYRADIFVCVLQLSPPTMSDAVSTPHNEPETAEQQLEVVLRVRHILMQEPGYFKGVCCYCGINVFATDCHMKVGSDYCHHACAYDRREAQRCLIAHARKALVLSQIAAKSE